jgi:hypothetical protein
MNTRAQKLRNAYRSLALLIFNTLLLLVLCNGVSFFLLSWRNPEINERGALRYGMSKLTQVYAGWQESEIRQLLQETWSQVYVYEPFVQFKERAVTGKYVNVSSEGIRFVKNQGPWPPDPKNYNVFVFGGSTTFGYGVPDGEAIPSYLQDEFAAWQCQRSIRVYNFARAHYYSSQERVLFERLLSAGWQPDAVIFIDGLNEFFYSEDEPKFSNRLRYLMVEDERQLSLRVLKELPVVQLAKSLWSSRDVAATVLDPAAAERASRQVLEHWQTNKQLIEAVAQDYGIRSFFIWQPVPTYGYDLNAHIFYSGVDSFFGEHQRSGNGYRMMNQVRHQPPLRDSRNFLWLADMQNRRREPLYVDAVHYTAQFAREIAREISVFLYRQRTCD